MAEKSKPKPKSPPKGARGAAGSKSERGGKAFYSVKAIDGAKYGGKQIVFGGKTVVIDGKQYILVEPAKEKPAPRSPAKPVAEIIGAVIAAKELEVPPDPPEYDAIPGVPSKAEIEAVAAELPKTDRAAFAELRTLLARHLGSHAAARVWFKSAVPGLEGTPLEAVKAGAAGRLLAVQKDHWGESATYA